MWTSTEKRLNAKEQNHVKVVVEEVADVVAENKAGVEWEMEVKDGTKTKCMVSKAMVVVVVVVDMEGKVTISLGISRDMGDSSKDMVMVNKAGDNKGMVSKGNKDMVNKHNRDMVNKHNRDMINQHNRDTVNKHNKDMVNKVTASRANRDTVSKVMVNNKEGSKVMVNKDISKMVK